MSKKAKYAFRAGARYKVAPQVAGVELERIRKARGTLSAQGVVDESRPEDAPLHPVFEWRDPVAAEHYRRYQARVLIRSVQVIQPETGEQRQQYVHVAKPDIAEDGTDEGAGYQPVDVVIQRPDMYAQALASLTAKMEQARSAVDELRRAAEEQPESDSEKLARIAIAVQAMQTASAAVAALH